MMVKEKNWMKKLSLQYEKTRNLHPADRFMVVFDIDGTILDMRYMILYVLRSFDRQHSTGFFNTLTVSDIKVHENQIDPLVRTFVPSPKQREEVLNWYVTYRWSSDAVLESHRPFEGVMEVIRWFQMQPNTSVGLNTGRPEHLRADTLRSLNALGKEYKVTFSNDLLYMNPHGWEKNVCASKAEGIRDFQRKGYRIFGYIDNEPENLLAVSEQDCRQEILLLHANTIFESKRKQLPSHSVRGNTYDITELIPERTLPRHVQFVWHGVNDEANLRQFATSNVQWAELDVRLDPMKEHVILRHDSFAKTPAVEGEEFILLDDALDTLLQLGKSVKLDLKENAILLEKVLALLGRHKVESTDLWFNGNVDVLQKEGFAALFAAYPEAIIQCPIDFLAPMIISLPEKTRETLELFGEWGMNRFSLGWKTPGMTGLLNQLDQWDFDVNIYNVPDLESFLRAVLLQPKSITSDFNFPKWHYFGRGSGENRKHYEYLMRS